MRLGLAGTLHPCPLLILPTCPPGCVRELRIQGEETIFHDLNLTAHGISHCPTCRDRPCQVAPCPHLLEPWLALRKGEGQVSLT